MSEPITLLELSRRISSQLAVASLQNVWVIAELSDVRVSRGHCYFELLQKDESGATTTAKIRGMIWASNFVRVRPEFYAVTGSDFTSGIKVMLRGSVTSHAVYGISFVVTDVNPDYTMGDRLRRRREILEKLKNEGILNLNRELQWPAIVQRVAVISARGAAGYGDFINQLFSNQRRLRFDARLFHATMQGASAPSEIIAALDAIAADIDSWDCVVIIRGGGATSDLEAFDEYRLAANIAQFPIPVIIGIGHERDVTVLDYVANMRVKTPTAAAEWLIHHAADALDAVLSRATAMQRIVSSAIASEQRHLAYFEGLLPVAPISALQRTNGRLQSALMQLSQISAKRIAPLQGRLASVAEQLPGLAHSVIARNRERLEARCEKLDLLSPQATLNRGYSITRVDGHSISDASLLPPGTVIETILAKGRVVSRTEG